MARYGPIRTRSRRAGIVVLAVLSYATLAPLVSNALAPPSAATWKSVSAGLGHTCAIASDDSAWCWGANYAGQLGNGTEDGAFTPVRVMTGIEYPSAWREISAGVNHTCGISMDDSLWCWGSNAYGGLGTGNTESSDVPVLASAASWTAVSAGFETSCGLISTFEVEGAAWCWGYDALGALGDDEDLVDSQVAVAVDTSGERPDTYSSISARGYTVCGISSDPTSAGTAWCWGSNLSGMAGVPAAETPPAAYPVPMKVENAEMGTVEQVATGGEAHTCAIATGGHPWCWGDNAGGFLGTGEEGDPSASSVPLSVVSMSPSETEIPVRFSSISVSYRHTCGISSQEAPSYLPGTLWCWGQDGYEQLGNGYYAYSSPYPYPVVSGGALPTTYSSVAAGWFHTCAIAADEGNAGTLWCWGQGGAGALGNVTGETSPYPVQVLGGVPAPSCTQEPPTSACHVVTYDILSFRSIALSSSDAVDFGLVRQGRTETRSGADILYATTWSGDAITVDLDADSPTGIDLLFDVLSIAAPTSGGCSEGGTEGIDQTADPIVLSTSVQTVIDTIEDCGQGTATSAGDVTATTEFTLDTSGATDPDTDYTTPVTSTVTYTIDAG